MPYGVGLEGTDDANYWMGICKNGRIQGRQLHIDGIEEAFVDVDFQKYCRKYDKNNKNGLTIYHELNPGDGLFTLYTADKKELFVMKLSWEKMKVPNGGLLYPFCYVNSGESNRVELLPGW
eukprot:UN25849